MMPKSKEILHGALLKGPLHTSVSGAANAWSGITSIASGSATVTVSTTVVKSDSLILCGLQSLTDTSSGFGRPVEVRTIVDGGYFILSHSDGEAQARAVKAHWMILNTK